MPVPSPVGMLRENLVGSRTACISRPVREYQSNGSAPVSPLRYTHQVFSRANIHSLYTCGSRRSRSPRPARAPAVLPARSYRFAVGPKTVIIYRVACYQLPPAPPPQSVLHRLRRSPPKPPPKPPQNRHLFCRRRRKKMGGMGLRWCPSPSM